MITVTQRLGAFLRYVVRQPLARRTWKEAGYAAFSLWPAVPAFAVALAGLTASALALVAVGLPLLGAVLLLARRSGAWFRVPARVVLDWDWASPPPLAASGLVGTVRAVLRDASAWRAALYGLVKLPLAAVTVYGAVVAVVFGVGALTAPVWWLWSRDGWGLLSAERSWPGAVELAVQGAVALLVFPWLVRFLVGLDRVLVEALLVPSRDAQRIQVLEHSREVLADDAAARLARVERDLHDGTQARFVTLGMTLSRLDQRIDDPEARQILTTARQMVDDGLAELRDIVRGLHPPALDDGLGVALATLAARSPVPTLFHDRLRTTPPPSTADALYYAAAELLTNVTRHAGASRVDLTVEEAETAFRLTVTDDGQGGAGAGPSSGTGLGGLRRRAEALDGTFVVNSPPGGPTRVVMALPS